MRAAVVRLARRSEHALYGLRTRAFDHIHALSIAHHAEERRGSLVARVTSDIETLSQFFQWGGIAWLLDGTLMIAVAVTMLVYDWLLALVAFTMAAPLFIILRYLQRHLVAAYGDVRERNADAMSAVSEVVMGAAVVRAYDLQEPTHGARRRRHPPPPEGRRPVPACCRRCCSRPARCAPCSPSPPSSSSGCGRGRRRA